MLLAFLAIPALAAQPKKRPEDHVQGKEYWEKSCWQCHGEENDGKGPAAEMLVDEVPDLRGKISPKRYDKLVPYIINGDQAHPAFYSEMDEHQAKRILIYLERMERDRKNPPKKIPPNKPSKDEEEKEAPKEPAAPEAP